MATKTSKKQSSKQNSSSKRAKSSTPRSSNQNEKPKKKQKKQSPASNQTLSGSKRGRKSRKTQEVIDKSLQIDKSEPVTIEKAAQAIPKNQYFTKVHEEAIIKYALSTDRHEKSVLYVTLIQPAFNEMVDKIVFTYKFTSLPNIDDLKEECKIWLTTILDKYDVSKGSKAFSYFSVITKNWFIHKVKKNSNGREVGLEEISQEFEEDNLFIINNYEDSREKSEFWAALWKEMDTWSRNIKKQNEKSVYDAIKQLVSMKEELEIFNKKAIYLYIRELTGLNTKQIVLSLNKFKNVYLRFLKHWNTGEYKQVKLHVESEKCRETTE